MFESSWLSALCTHTPSLPFERALPSNVPLRATLCGISSRERKKEKDERERERTLYESQEHRPPASRNLRRDCCAPRAHRVPEALSLVRGHRKSPEDDQLTEDPLPSNSSCRRPPYFVLCSLSLLPPPSPPPLSLSPRVGDVTVLYRLNDFSTRSFVNEDGCNDVCLASIPRIRSYTNAKKIYNSMYTHRARGNCVRSLRLSLSLLSLSCIIFRRREKGLACIPRLFFSCHETRGNARFNCRSKINSRLKMRGT